jgi:hypothetical protein
LISRGADDFACLLIRQPRLTHSDFPIERLASFWFVLAGNFLARATLEEAESRELLLQNDLFLKHQ